GAGSGAVLASRIALALRESFPVAVVKSHGYRCRNAAAGGADARNVAPRIGCTPVESVIVAGLKALPEYAAVVFPASRAGSVIARGCVAVGEAISGPVGASATGRSFRVAGVVTIRPGIITRDSVRSRSSSRYSTAGVAKPITIAVSECGAKLSAILFP